MLRRSRITSRPRAAAWWNRCRSPGSLLTVIDESYNASPAAVRFAIRVLGQMTPGLGGRRILVLGDMREFGAAAPALHAELARDIIEAKIAIVFCCGEMAMHLFEALPKELRGAWSEDSATLAPEIAAAIRPGDIVTVKGSKSMHMETVVDALIALGETPKPHKRRRADMLYHLLAPFAHDFILFNLFRYITFRTGGALATSLIICFVFGPGIIRWLRKKQGEGQPIRSDGPETHLKRKARRPWAA